MTHPYPEFSSKSHVLIKKSILLLLWTAFLVSPGFIPPVYSQQDSTSTHKKQKVSFKDPEDGAFDVSAFLKSRQGFMFIPIIVTQPAIGYGGGGAVTFFHPHKAGTSNRIAPNISGILGLGTQNKTWMAGAFHFHVFGNDKVRTLTLLAKPVIHIDYYGNNNEFLSKNPVQLNMNAFTARQRAMVRLAKSNWFVGATYILFRTNNTLDTLPGKPLINKLLEKLNGTSTISVIQPAVNFDNRDNIFTPTSGVLTGVTFSYSATWLGADNDYYVLNTFALGYIPVVKNKLFSGWRFDGSFVIGEAPAYALPFIQIEGIPSMKYQSDNTMVVETRWRYQFYKRWSLVAFTGAGKAFTSLDTFKEIQWAYTYGTGFRYELARAFGIHYGMDFAWGDGKDFAFYFVFGSAWNK